MPFHKNYRVVSNSENKPETISIKKPQLNLSIDENIGNTLSSAIDNHIISSGQVIAKLQSTTEKVNLQDLSRLIPTLVKTYLPNVGLNVMIGKVIEKITGNTNTSQTSTTKNTHNMSHLGINNPKYNKKLNEQINNKTKDSIAIGLNKICSFRGDMEVKTNSGYKPIEKLVIGERVLSRNELTGLVTYQKNRSTL